MEERRADAFAVTLVAVLTLGGLAGVSFAGGIGQGTETDAASPPTAEGTVSASPHGTGNTDPDRGHSTAPTSRHDSGSGTGGTVDGTAGSGDRTADTRDDGIPDRVLPAAMLSPSTGSQDASGSASDGSASDGSATGETAEPPSDAGGSTAPPALPPGHHAILPGPGTPTPMHTRPANDGSHVVDEKWAAAPNAPQALDVTIYSQALGKNTTARLLVPRGWTPTRQWPTLYMLAGYNDWHRQDSWTAYTDIATFMSDKQAIAVLPNTGRAAFPNNWKAGPQYETYVTKELPAVLKSYGAGSTHAIAGLSVGGYGAMALAARHPDEYEGVASYSGILHTTLPGISQFVQYLLSNIGIDPDSLWGDPLLNSAMWRANDPWVQAPKLRGMDIFVSSGTGIPGRHDQNPLKVLEKSLTSLDLGSLQAPTQATLLEAGSNVTTHSFALRCATLGIPVTTDYTLTGTHSWGYWRDAFHKSWSSTLAPALGITP